MIYKLECNINDLTDIFSKQTFNSAIICHEDNLQAKDNKVILLWAKDPNVFFALPTAIIVEDSEVKNFLAWINTYFRHFRPFSAFCRVITNTQFEKLYHKDISKEHCLKNKFHLAFLGLIISETIIYSFEHTPFEKIPLPAFFRSLSYVCAKSFNSMQNYIDLDNIRSSWDEMRSISGQAKLLLPSIEVLDVWKTLMKIYNINEYQSSSPESFLPMALNEVSQVGEISSKTWIKITKGLPKYRYILNELMGAREERVGIIKQLLSSLTKGTYKTQNTRAFISGYLVYRIQPGTLEHFALLTPNLRALPESLLWYGTLAGLNPKSSLLNYGNGLGRILARELNRQNSLLSPPDCDISLAEMALLLQGGDKSKFEIPMFTPGSIRIEIIPTVCSTVKWITDKKSDNSNQKHDYKQNNERASFFQQSLFDNDNIFDDVSYLISQLDDLNHMSFIIKNNIKKELKQLYKTNN